jgi:MoaA/NifB/PqqE/SkfB family radical SAM enzyme
MVDGGGFSKQTLMRRLERFGMMWKYGTNFRKPLYMARLTKEVIHAQVGSKAGARLRGIDFAINYGCNFKCKFCFNDRLLRNAPLMQPADYERVVKDAMDLGATLFSFQGGETIMFKKKLFDILDVIPRNRNRIPITTNAWFLDEASLKELRDHGVDSINISLGSFDSKTHDSFRLKEGSYERCIKGIELCLRKGINVSINTVVSHDNIHDEHFLNLIKYADTNNILINVMFAAPTGGWEGNKDVLMTAEDLAHLRTLREKYHCMVHDSDANYIIKKGCPGGKESLHISPYGDVLGCPFVQISLGNVMHESLKDIYARIMKNPYFGKYNQYCLIGEDHDFMKRYIKVIDTAKKQLPLSEDHYGKMFQLKESEIEK